MNYAEIYANLVESVKEMDDSIKRTEKVAIDAYGHEHIICQRIGNLKHLVDKQWKLTAGLKDIMKKKFITSESVNEIWSIVNKINAISELIKAESYALIEMMFTGQSPPVDDIMH